MICTLSEVLETLSSTLSSEMGCKDTDFFFTSKSFSKNFQKNRLFISTFDFCYLKITIMKTTLAFIWILQAIVLAAPATASGHDGNDKESEKDGPAGSSLTIGACHYGLNIDRNGVSEYYEIEGERPPRVSGSLGIASLDFGFNILAGTEYYGPWADQGNFLDMNGWKSIRVAWEPASVTIALDRKAHVSLVAGVRILADNYTFSRPYTLVYNDMDNVVPAKIDGYVKKSKLVATYIGIPIRLSFRIGSDLHITGYASGDLLLNGRTKYKKPKVKGNISCFSPFRISAGGSITYNNFGVYCEYGTTPLFKDGTGADTHTVSVGLRFGI